jgi:hypothetical protein
LLPLYRNLRNSRKNIEAFRLAPKAKETVAVGEIFRDDAFERRAEAGERGVGRLGIFRIWT